MKAIVLISLIGIAAGVPAIPTALIKSVIDNLFVRLDHSPKDNLITQAEWDTTVAYDDVDNNGCETLAEYTAHSHVPLQGFNVNMFNNFDHDGDGCMTVPDMNTEFQLMDADGDGSATLQEFEGHMTDIIVKQLTDAFNAGTLFG